MLTKNNLKKYLIKRKAIEEGESVKIEEIRIGTINRLFRVKTKSRNLVVKQFLNKPRIGENLILPSTRYYYERKAIEYLNRTLKEKITPPVLFFDDKNKAICMEDLGESNRADNLIAEGKLKPRIFSKIGKALAEMHTLSFYNEEARNTFIKNEFEELKIFYRYYKYKEINNPLFKKIKDELVEKIQKNSITFLHHDLKLNNLFVIKNKFYFIDYEGAYYGDPAMEIGYFLGQLFIYYFNQPTKKNKKIVTNFWHNYIKDLQFKFKKKLEYNTVKNIGFTIIYKLVGITKHEFKFVSEKSKNKMIRTAERIILNKNIKQVGQIFALK